MAREYTSFPPTNSSLLYCCCCDPVMTTDNSSLTRCLLCSPTEDFRKKKPKSKSDSHLLSKYHAPQHSPVSTFFVASSNPFQISSFNSSSPNKHLAHHQLQPHSSSETNPKPTAMTTKKRPLETDELKQEHARMMDLSFRSSVESVQVLLSYSFRDVTLLEAALTHSSYADAVSYQRLEFIGDAALGLALANFVFITYPGLDPGDLSLLRSANISTEKLARVAVRHGLFEYIRHNSPDLNNKVARFSVATGKEGDQILPYGGTVKAPKVLADIVESIAAALYVDCNFDLKKLWKHFSPLLEPIVTMDNLTQQPVTMLYELCQKQGRDLKFFYDPNGRKTDTRVVVDGDLWGSSTSDNKEISKLSAAKEALERLYSEPAPVSITIEMANGEEISGAKQKLFDRCSRKNPSVPKPAYRIVKEDGPSHDKRFTCSVRVETSAGVIEIRGDPKPKLKDAESSAASMMLHHLNENKPEIQTNTEGCNKLRSFSDAPSSE